MRDYIPFSVFTLAMPMKNHSSRVTPLLEVADYTGLVRLGVTPASSTDVLVLDLQQEFLEVLPQTPTLAEQVAANVPAWSNEFIAWFNALPTSLSGLRPGDFYNNGGELAQVQP